MYLGNAGISKTYFLAACVRHFYLTRPCGFISTRSGEKLPLPPDICKHTEKSFYAALISQFDNAGDSAGYGRYLADCDVFMLDEMGKTIGTEWQKQELNDLIDTRYNMSNPTLIVSNFNRQEIENHYGERYGKYLTSRLFDRQNCILEDFSGPDLRATGV